MNKDSDSSRSTGMKYLLYAVLWSLIPLVIGAENILFFLGGGYHIRYRGIVSCKHS